MDKTTIKRGPYEIIVLTVRSDNFVYLVCRGDNAVLVDAGEADPVRNAIEAEGLVLCEIRTTHGHGDHTAGLDELRPLCRESVPDSFGTIETLQVPGHTNVFLRVATAAEFAALRSRKDRF